MVGHQTVARQLDPMQKTRLAKLDEETATIEFVQGDGLPTGTTVHDVVPRSFEILPYSAGHAILLLVTETAIMTL